MIRWGQKDLRGGSHTYSQYGVIEADGSARDVTDAEAATYYQVDRNSMTPPDHAATLAGIPTEALEAEIARRRGLENYMTPEEK
ncbi:hypothetical protein KKF45_05730 [Patescibacteria group bacterium]|nr:hypothetical protein [Patescibacteria group bacterium]